MITTIHPKERREVTGQHINLEKYLRFDTTQIWNMHLPIRTHMTQLETHLTRDLNHEWKWEAFSFPKECHGSNTGAYGSTKHECWICADMTHIMEWGLSARFLKFLSSSDFSLVETFHFLYQLILCTVTWCDHLTANKDKVPKGQEASLSSKVRVVANNISWTEEFGRTIASEQAEMKIK